MRKVVFPLFCVFLLTSCDQNKTTAEADKDSTVKSTTAPPGDKQMPSEFADPKYMDMGKQMMTDFQGGNIDAYGENFADNAVYEWSGGDSLAGKKAIVDYWKNRFANVVQTVKMSNDIWLPIKINVPQKGPDMPGVWLLGWHQVNVSYKNGKSLQFWVHQDMHYDNNNKVDRLVMYMDRAPINAALGAK